MKYFLYCLKHYADFGGRARRSEFWYFQLFNFLIEIGIYLIVLAIKEVIGIDLGFLRFVYPIALFIPNLAVSARRLHDTNRSGWWQLLTIITGLIMYGFVMTFAYLLCLYAIWGIDMPGFSIFHGRKAAFSPLVRLHHLSHSCRNSSTGLVLQRQPTRGK